MSEIRWTAEQLRAIYATGDTLLAASAGTGKTTTVAGKILWQLGIPFGVGGDTGEPLVPPKNPCRLDQIAAITFTEKAACNLKRQLAARIEASPRGEELRWEIDSLSVGTIHSFCGELLREHALRLGIDPTFEVMDEDEAWAEQDLLIKELILERMEANDPSARTLLQRMRLSGRGHARGAVDHVRTVLRDLRWRGRSYARWLAADGSAGVSLDLPAIETAWDKVVAARNECFVDEESLEDKNGFREWTPGDDEALAICDALIDLASEAQRRWEASLLEDNRRDFDSLILEARNLLAGPRGKAALAAIQRRYRILVIDEFQDTDFAQRDIALAIASLDIDDAARPQLFLVGDPKQSIYRFRGADISVWNQVVQGLGDRGEVLDLSRNFRSLPRIIDFVNSVGNVALGETGDKLAAERPRSRVDYAALEADAADDWLSSVEWIVVNEGRAGPQREAEAAQIAARIEEVVGNLAIRDPATGELRSVAYRDIALLYRARTGLEQFKAALTSYGIPHYVAGLTHLASRQEIMDVLNVLRLLDAEWDDLRAFGYLRSPFVGLRDETIARMRLLQESAPLLAQARIWQAEGEWPEAPDHPELARIEREALAVGLETLDDLRRLAPRISVDELIEELLDRTGYRLHILMMDRADAVMANLQSLIHFAEDHRGDDLSAFLEIWDRSTTRDVGVPQAALDSAEDDLVILTTIHQAKGLEWPLVFLASINQPLWRAPANEYFFDPELGPLYALKKKDRGGRGNFIVWREQLEAEAEEARLLYVAVSRARDHLVIVGSDEKRRGYNHWLVHGGASRLAPSSKMESFGTARPPGLDWLDRYTAVEPPALIAPRPEPSPSWAHSATELMLRSTDPEAWERRYRHGVLDSEMFAPAVHGEATAPSLSPLLRGKVIHGVLERLEEEEELSRILDETIGSLDEPELDYVLRSGSKYRERMEHEIRRVVTSEEWRWYTEGEVGRDYWKELRFVHIVGPRDWRIGAMDLFRRVVQPSSGARASGAEDCDTPNLLQWGAHPLSGASGESAERGERVRTLVIDFKTHRITADQAMMVAREYDIQAAVYRAAARLAGKSAVGLHFTVPNILVPMRPERDRAAD